MPLDSNATATTATNSATYFVNSRLRVLVPDGAAGDAPSTGEAASVLPSGVSGCSEMVIEPNLARWHALVSCRTAAGSFDHLVGPRKQGRGDVQAERFRRFEVYDEFKFGRLLDRQIPGLGAAENLVNERRRAEIEVRLAHPVSHQSAGVDELP